MDSLVNLTSCKFTTCAHYSVHFIIFIILKNIYILVVVHTLSLICTIISPIIKCCLPLKRWYNSFLVYCRELAPGTVSLTGDWAQGNDNKHDSHSNTLHYQKCNICKILTNTLTSVHFLVVHNLSLYSTYYYHSNNINPLKRQPKNVSKHDV